MSDPKSAQGETDTRRSALSRWDDEGGAIFSVPTEAADEIPEISNTEMVHLRVRVIALENLLIAVLAEGSDKQIAVAREMAEYIAPRSGSTQHPLTVKAGNHMASMIERALHFRTVEPPSPSR